MTHADEFVHNCIRMPMLRAAGGDPTFANHACGNISYSGPGIFLPATYPHAPRPVTLRVGRGKNSTAYLTFERSSAIERSTIIEVQSSLIHCDVIGSREDGFLAYLFKRMDGFELIAHQGTERIVQIDYQPNPIVLARCRTADVHPIENKYIAAPGTNLARRQAVESGVTVYAI